MLKPRILLLLLLTFCIVSAKAAADDAARGSSQTSIPVTITVSTNSAITMQSETLTTETLVARLHALTLLKLDTPIVFYVEPNVSYGRVIEAMGLVSAADYDDVKLASPPQ